MTNNAPLTVAYIRDQIAKGQYVGDLFQAVEFLLKEIDRLSNPIWFVPTESTSEVYESN